MNELQQHLAFTVCAEGCETAEEQSDDEVRTSQVPERSEGKTRVIRDSAVETGTKYIEGVFNIRVLKLIKLNAFSLLLFNCCNSSYRLRY